MSDVALRSEHLNLISICTGGGGLDLGVELAIPCARSVCLVEREAFGVTQLVSAMQQGLMAQAPVWSDARTFNGRAWRGAVDGLIGGIPCQPHSLAGRKQGSLDERDLWSPARRIIVQSGAWFVLIENVGGMLSAGSDEIAGAQRVFGDLSKLGFEVEGGLFTASEVGASHQRERIFILAVADRDGEHGDRARVERAGRRGQSANGRGELADPDRARPQGRGTAMVRADGKIRNDMLDWVAESWSTPRASDGEKGSPNQAFGAGGIPLPAQAVNWPSPMVADSRASASATAGGAETRVGYTPGVTLTDAIKIYSLPAQPTSMNGEVSSTERRSLNPLFVEWLMGWPPDWTLLAWTDFGCSEMGLYLYKQRMRSALSQLASPAAAPPAQLALFA